MENSVWKPKMVRRLWRVPKEGEQIRGNVEVTGKLETEVME